MAPMKAMKAKAVTTTVGSSKFVKSIRKSLAMKRPAAAEAEEQEDVEEEEQKSKKTMKRPAAAPAAEPAAKKSKKESPKAAEEKALVERTKELKSTLVAELKDLVKSKGMEKGTKPEMVDAILAFEAKAREEANAHEAKIKEVASTIKKDFAAKSSPDLKELCVSKGLKKGGSKEDLLDRLVEKAKADGEVQKILAAEAREARRQALLGMGKDELSTMCEKSGVDPLVKEVMVERLLGAEMSLKA
jgi:hypothetical protein